ncbi:MAG: nitroreductase/quinone reductase family protein [Anaerolineaceae bacterium]
MATYQKPDFATSHIFNPLVATATKLGISMRGSRILAVRGRQSGEWRSTPVNPLTLGDARYLVAPRGDTQWVRNIRVSGEGVLKLGRKSEIIRVSEIGDEEKLPIIRAYLRAWASETKKFFGVADANVPDDELRRIAPNHPVFRIG